MKRRLVLGLAYQYELETLFPFVVSLRRSGYEGEVCLFISEDLAHGHRFFARHRIQIIPIELRYPYSDSLTPIPGLSADDFVDCAPHYQRFVMYHLFLEELGERYDEVLLTDVRDVVFQGDPFSFDWEGASLCCFLEDERVTLPSCPWNSGWLLRQYGKKVLAGIGDNHISCSGTIFGTSAAIRAYLAAMIQEIRARRLIRKHAIIVGGRPATSASLD